MIQAGLGAIRKHELERRVGEKYAGGDGRAEALGVVIHLTNRGPWNLFPEYAEAGRRPGTSLLTFDLEKLDLVGAVRTVEDGKVIEVVEHRPIIHARLVDLQNFRQ